MNDKKEPSGPVADQIMDRMKEVTEQARKHPSPGQVEGWREEAQYLWGIHDGLREAWYMAGGMVPPENVVLLGFVKWLEARIEQHELTGTRVLSEEAQTILKCVQSVFQPNWAIMRMNLDGISYADIQEQFGSQMPGKRFALVELPDEEEDPEDA